MSNVESSTIVPPAALELLKPSSYTLATPRRPIKVRSLKDARRLLSRLIVQLQVGECSGPYAKDLTYLLSTFITLVRDYELEQRLTALERRAKEHHG